MGPEGVPPATSSIGRSDLTRTRQRKHRPSRLGSLVSVVKRFGLDREMKVIRSGVRDIFTPHQQ